MDGLQIKSESIISTVNGKLYLCDICNECYSLERSFKLHYRAHKSFQCEVCCQVFTLKRDLYIHRRTHNESKKETKQNYICSECDKEFLYKCHAKKHIKCRKKKRSVCKICKKEFSDIKTLKRHKITHKKAHVCEGCCKCFQYISDLKKHTCVAIVQPFKPSNATIDYLNRIHFRTHNFDEAKNHFNETQTKYVCAECDKEFLSKIKVQKHMKCHEKKQYVCKICKKEFDDIKKLRRHKITHRNYVCQGCQARFHYKLELKKHASICTVQAPQPSDDLKQEVFDSEADVSSLSENGKSHSVDTSVVKQELDDNFSSPDKPYFCKMCGKGFKRNSSLGAHICAIKKSDYIAERHKKRRKTVSQPSLLSHKESFSSITDVNNIVL